ncbi:MAG TPA: prephenate dehydrogenase/arogenate dehydrogenase family protein [Candidatus Limnocylindria bacterium]|nr:prephenate dehydrogenase/arogenate dehydrogenase family protein [Candidatus Limnocylindria bacterium]
MRIGVAGLGLIGGSLALALHGTHDLTGFDVDRATRDAARARGIRTVDALEALLPADAVVVATPLRAVLPTLAALAPRAGGAVVLDVSSVRTPVEGFVREHPDGARVVGMHPMAGRSASGFGMADARLLAGRSFLVVPTASSDSEAVRVAGCIARDAGGVVTVCSAAEHDRIVAVTSALPLALAAALAIAGADATAQLAAFAGPGFRDATRLADTPPDLAESLLAANAGNVVAALARLRAVLDELERAVAERDAPAVRATLERAASARALLG